MALLVDPLAAFFKPALAEAGLLLLDAVDVEIELLPPLARVSVTRRFRNRGDELIEAVLTLPPPAAHEVIHGVTVTIDGIVCRAAAQSGARAAQLHHDAVLAGRRAILHELVDTTAQLLSIAGIAAGAEVTVRIDSIRPLRRIDDRSARLEIALTASPRLMNWRLSDADALVTSPLRHAATLTVMADGLAVAFADPASPLSSGVPCPVDCVENVRLVIGAAAAGGLDRSAAAPSSPGGWQAVAVGSDDHRYLQLVPDRAVTGGRRDWMFGRMQVDGRDIQVTAALPDAGSLAPTPQAQAMSAFTAASLVAAARAFDAAAVCLAANVLRCETHLVFIGPDGELPDTIPVLRKLALAHAAAADTGFDSISFAAEADEADDVDEAATPVPPGADPAPGVRQPLYLWLIWAPALLLIVWVLGATRVIDVPLGPVLAGFVVLMLLNAVRWFPRVGAARRRLPLLAVLAVPVLISLLLGPMGLIEIGGTQAQRDAMVQFQGWLLAVSVVLPLLLMPVMRGARAFTAAVGVLAFVASFLVVSTAIIMNMPGA